MHNTTEENIELLKQRVIILEKRRYVYAGSRRSQDKLKVEEFDFQISGCKSALEFINEVQKRKEPPNQMKLILNN